MRRSANLFGRTLRDDLAAVLARARPHVDNVVGGQNGILVVLDHDHAVAEIAQVLESGQQPIVVPLMQPDRRLVEDIHHSGEARADLRCKPDALRLAARKRFRGPVERQVIEPDVVQELQPGHDLLDDLVGDRLTLSLELHVAEELARLLERPVAHLEDRALVSGRAYLDVTRFAPQPGAIALGTRLGIEVFCELLAHHDRVSLAVTSLEVGDDALEGMLAHHRLAAVGKILECDLFLVAAVQDHLLHAFGQPVEAPFPGRSRSAWQGFAASGNKTDCAGPIP